MADPGSLRYRSRVRPGLALVIAVVGVVILVLAVEAVILRSGQAPVGGWAPPLVVALLLVLWLPFFTVEATVDHREVVVHCPGLAATRRFPLAEITAVDTRPEVRALGWGMRWVGPGHWALVVGGPAVTLQLVDGRRFTFSVADPAALAAAARA